MAIHHRQVPDLEQTVAAMPVQTSLSSDNFKKFKPLLCPPVAELQRLSKNVIVMAITSVSTLRGFGRNRQESY